MIGNWKKFEGSFAWAAKKVLIHSSMANFIGRIQNFIKSYFQLLEGERQLVVPVKMS